jgi:hypothetical protein
MGRPHVEFIRSQDVEPQPAARPGPFAGCLERVLSRDEQTSAFTALLSTPSGWASNLDAEGPIELFVLEGEFELGGQPVGAGCYAYLPPSAGPRRLSGRLPGHFLAMVEAPVETSSGRAGSSLGSVSVKDTREMRWAASSFAEVPAGLVNKRLRDDPDTGERTWVAACPPGWMEERAEVHPTVEESLTLRGDILLGSRGAMTPGCYFWRPPMVPHGPMYSRTGAEFFFRTKGGALEVAYETVPEWDRLVDEYRGREQLYGEWMAATEGP